MISKIISGGQTGADRGGLRAAKVLGIETGGWAPKGWKTEKGIAPWLEEKYGMKECQKDGYPARTVLNIKESDGTVVFGSIQPQHKGSRLTWDMCSKYKKPCCHFDVVKGQLYMVQASQFFLDWIKANKIKVLNVAGNRESSNPNICDAVKAFLERTLNADTNHSRASSRRERSPEKSTGSDEHRTNRKSKNTNRRRVR